MYAYTYDAMWVELVGVTVKKNVQNEPNENLPSRNKPEGGVHGPECKHCMIFKAKEVAHASS